MIRLLPKALALILIGPLVAASSAEPLADTIADRFQPALDDLEGNRIALTSLHAEAPLFLACISDPQQIEPAFRWLTLVHSQPASAPVFHSALLYLTPEQSQAFTEIQRRALDKRLSSPFLRRQAFFGRLANQSRSDQAPLFLLVDPAGQVVWETKAFPGEEEWSRALATFYSLP